ncbi:hypothetical protein [Candidatus Proelusimicrobium excrementi]|uniref:hypothetical protein n=1 Tax=Candidatus Proelusimicrobium excrementi TaxID=3416222 RepID=UPI003CC4BE2A|nr:hypothetical protein [Elusimicrobiaceae bacterium]
MRKYNKEQTDYIETKKALDALEAREKELEAAFVKSLGVTNEDGSVPSRTWAIDDDAIADQAIDDFGVLVEECGLWKELCEAKEAFQAAEERLVNYALSLIPCKKEREILTAASSNLKYRIQIIETVMKLDTKTVTR